MYVYVDFCVFLAKKGREKASGPLSDRLAPQPYQKSKFWLHGSIDNSNIFQMSHQPRFLNDIFIPKSGTKNFVVC